MASHHSEVVVSVDVDEVFFGCAFVRGSARAVVAVTVKANFYGFAAMAFDGGLFHSGSGERHVNDRTRTEFFSSQRHTLRMITRRSGDNARS